MPLRLHHSFCPLKRLNVQLESTNHSSSRLTGTLMWLLFCNTAIYQSVFCRLCGCLVFASLLQCGTSGTHVCGQEPRVCSLLWECFAYWTQNFVSLQGYQYCVSPTRSTATRWIAHGRHSLWVLAKFQLTARPQVVTYLIPQAWNIYLGPDLCKQEWHFQSINQFTFLLFGTHQGSQ